MSMQITEESATTISNQQETNAETSNDTSPTLFHSSSIIDRKSKFVAHAKKVLSKEEAESFWREVQATEKGATHNILAYRIQLSDGTVIEEYHDDGETYAGNRVLTLLKTLDAKNVVVVVTRWFGGQMLGPIRFDHILKCSREVLDKGSLINTNKSLTSINKRVGYSTNSIIVNGCQVFISKKDVLLAIFKKGLILIIICILLTLAERKSYITIHTQCTLGIW
jgi:putative IMPACT (imprinted ancient) family translation regulator